MASDKMWYVLIKDLLAESDWVKVSDSGMSGRQQTLLHTSILWGQRATDDSSLKWPPGQAPPGEKSLLWAAVSLNLCFFSGYVTFSDLCFILMYDSVSDWNPATVTLGRNLAKHLGSYIIMSHWAISPWTISSIMTNLALSFIVNESITGDSNRLKSLSPHQSENNPPHVRVKCPRATLVVECTLNSDLWAGPECWSWPPLRKEPSTDQWPVARVTLGVRGAVVWVIRGECRQ